MSALAISCVAIAAAEACIAYWNVSIGAVLDAALAFVLVNAFLLGELRAGRPDATRERPAWAVAALALALVPVARLVSLAMSVGEGTPLGAYALVGASLLVGALLAIYVGPFEQVRPRLTTSSWRPQLLIAAAGVPLGIAAFAVERPIDPFARTGSWAHLIIASAVLVVFSAFAEEVLFRGVLQEGLTQVFGPAGVAIGAVLFGSTYLAVGGAYAAFATVVGLAFGWLVRRTDSLVGVALSHGLMNVGLLVVWPLALR